MCICKPSIKQPYCGNCKELYDRLGLLDDLEKDVRALIANVDRFFEITESGYEILESLEDTIKELDKLYKESEAEFKMKQGSKEILWEPSDQIEDLSAERVKIYGGWLVKNDGNMVFIPDPNHLWEEPGDKSPS